MSSGSGSDRETVMAVYEEWQAVNAKVAALSLDALTEIELLELEHRREVVAAACPSWTIRSSTGWPPMPTPKRWAVRRWPMYWPTDWLSARAKPSGGSN